MAPVYPAAQPAGDEADLPCDPRDYWLRNPFPTPLFVEPGDEAHVIHDDLLSKTATAISRQGSVHSCSIRMVTESCLVGMCEPRSAPRRVAVRSGSCPRNSRAPPARHTEPPVSRQGRRRPTVPSRELAAAAASNCSGFIGQMSREFCSRCRERDAEHGIIHRVDYSAVLPQMARRRNLAQILRGCRILFIPELPLHYVQLARGRPVVATLALARLWTGALPARLCVDFARNPRAKLRTHYSIESDRPG